MDEQDSPSEQESTQPEQESTKPKTFPNEVEDLSLEDFMAPLEDNDDGTSTAPGKHATIDSDE
jgi:hypothetical protein